jgi:DNA-binding cell septation regulator SpoVG
MLITVSLKPGPATGKPAYFASINLDDKVEIQGGPVWNGSTGQYRYDPPSKVTEKGTRVKLVNFSPTTLREIQEAVAEEVKRHQDSR